MTDPCVIWKRHVYKLLSGGSRDKHNDITFSIDNVTLDNSVTMETSPET